LRPPLRPEKQTLFNFFFNSMTLETPAGHAFFDHGNQSVGCANM
jgi:hypothetical protein